MRSKRLIGVLRSRFEEGDFIWDPVWGQPTLEMNIGGYMVAIE